ncbi:MAG: type I methionyl aminopeptidase [Alphaproteobacteria bacterium]|nr:type I methionyl aminopeptidase [Alphaproteobacteria bacterium]
MTISHENELEKLREIGRIVANVLRDMQAAARPGMTTGELDAIGAKLLDAAGARSAPQVTYDFPGATCISINEQIAHGIPGARVIEEGDLINIDVSAEKDGFFGDTGASMVVGTPDVRLARLTRDGKRALWTGIGQVKTGARLNGIGRAIEAFARKNRYTLVRNLASHGVGRALHEEPEHLATWNDPSDRRVMHEGLVFTIEPFLSLGATWAAETDDGWTLVSAPNAPTVQYEHTMVVTRRGAMVLTQPG